MEQKEFILCAAIHFENGAETTTIGIKDGIIISGFRHGDCYAVLKGILGDVDISKLPNRDSQGFLTSKNRYVGREEAWIIAKENNQIIYGLEASDHDNDILLDGLNMSEKPKSILISENLY